MLFSHGLRGSPERYAAALGGWAAAGFVVAAPFYPHTNEYAAHFDRADIVNQPRDAAYVIKKVRRLDGTPGDPLAGRIDADQVAAVGHSAGGYTTAGLFAANHPAWLRGGVIIAGWLAPGAFAGPPATVLFLHGDRDTVVPLASGRAAYEAAGSWTKSFVLLPDSWHADYMSPGGKAYPLMNAAVTDFLRWTLDNDRAARLRLPPAGARTLRPGEDDATPQNGAHVSPYSRALPCRCGRRGRPQFVWGRPARSGAGVTYPQRAGQPGSGTDRVVGDAEGSR